MTVKGASDQRAWERVKELEAQLKAVREHWPHIELPVRGVVKDPGAPGCLRCKIEDLISGAH